MLITLVPATFQSLEEERTDAFCCSFFQDERPARGMFGTLDFRMSAALSALRVRGFLTGDLGEALMVPLSREVPVAKLLAFGLGPRAVFDEAAYSHVLHAQVKALMRLGVARIALELPGRPSSFDPEAALDRALLELESAELEGAIFSKVRIFEPEPLLKKLTLRLQERRRKSPSALAEQDALPADGKP